MVKHLLYIILFLLTISAAYSQTPNGISYQAIARNNMGQPINDKNIKVRFSILKDNSEGIVEYQETHSLTTSVFGLFTTIIGNGTSIIGNFSAIDWTKGYKFLKVEVDLNNSNAFELQGITQLLSVPFSFYAEKSGHADTAKYALTPVASLTSGAGISISGNTISNSSPGRWTKNNNNLYYSEGPVAIGSSVPYAGNLGVYKFTVKGGNSNSGDETVMITSDSRWETQLGINNSTSNGYFLNVTGPSNTRGSGKFFIVRSKTNSTYPFTISANDFIGINQIDPSSSLEVKGDIELSEVGNGIIMRSPNGNCFRVTLDNSGNFISTQIACP